MFGTSSKRQLAVGLVLLALLLGLFVWFNRIPKLDVVEADLAGATAARAECFQGFCLEEEDGRTLLERWWRFSWTYLRLVAPGMLFAFLVAGLAETFLLPPQGSRFWAGRGLRGSFSGLLVGPAMNLCSACIVPVANAFRQRGAGPETAIAIVHGSSTLNLPALLMAALVFTPLLAGSRLGLSLVAALLLGPLVAWLVGRGRDRESPPPPPIGNPELAPLPWRALLQSGLKDWAKSSLGYVLRLGPLMVLAGFGSALVIQWISPETVGKYLGDNPQGVAVAATLGLLINVPLLFEIPLVAALLLAGMGTAPAATLLFAAAAGGPITFWGLARVMPKRAIATLGAATWGLGLLAGLCILALNPLVDGGPGLRAAAPVDAAAANPRYSALQPAAAAGNAANPASDSAAVEPTVGELTITAVEPSIVGTNGDVLVTIHGRGFVNGAGITIAGVEAAWAWFGPERMQALAPAHAPGPADLILTNPDGAAVAAPAALTYQPPVFREAAENAGARFTHYRDLLDLIPLGAGVVALDYNGDGLTDIYVTATPDLAGLADPAAGGGANALYANQGGGAFTEVAAAVGVADAEAKSNGGCAADYDNDGDQDLFVANWGGSKLFRNDGPTPEGGWRFTDATAAAGLGDPDATYRTMGCAWGDYDRDGALDLAVVRHIDESNPDAFTKRIYYFDVRPLALFRNDGVGGFADVTALLGGPANPGRTGGEYGNIWGAGFQPAWLDYDNDGDADLYVVNDFGEYIQPNVLWRNDGPAPDGGWRFADVSAESGAGVPMFGMGVAVADYNADGWLDLFVTNIGDNVLLAGGDGGVFRDAAAAAGVASGEFRRQQRVSWGTAFFDYDNDGYEDLYVASGFLDTDDINRRQQPNLLFRNNGGAGGAGGFTDVSAISGAADWGIGRGLAYADFNADGCLDLYLANLGRSASSGEPSRLYLNRCDWENNWLIVRLTGAASNRDGIGARIILEAGGRRQIREIAAGASNSSQNMLPAHFGLGKADLVETLEIRWPSGANQTLTNLTPNQTLTITEPPP